jgi:Fe2+ or Zn2+ uptake regulation protein
MKTNLDDKVRGMLKTAELYCTEARVAVLKVLLRAPSPLRQNQIAARLATKTLNKVTIYRTLESLVEAGLVHRAFMQKRAWHFELAHHCSERQCHPHFTCLDCGDTHCLTGVSLPMAKSPLKGFVISRQQVRLEGWCPACAENRSAGNTNN